MNSEKMFEMLNDIDDEYIEEANIAGKSSHEINNANNKNNKSNMSAGIKQILYMAAALAIIAISSLIIINLGKKNADDKALQVIAAEVGKEEIHFGATMPRIINVSEEKVIMYDYVGIWVYDMKEEKLVGFCDFRPIGMTQIQGYPCVFVEASEDGQYVRFYMSDGSKKYLYDVKKNEYEEVDEYNSENDSVSQMVISADKQLSIYSETFMLEEDYYISYVIDTSGNVDEVKYGDLIVVTEKSGEERTYRIFQ